MPRPLLRLTLVVTLMTGAPSALTHPAPLPAPIRAGSAVGLSHDAAEAAATVDAFHAALRAGNTAKAAELLADDLVVFEAGFAEPSKAVYAAEHLAADAAFEKTAGERLLRRVGQASGGMAWIASEGVTRAMVGDHLTERLTTESMVLRRTPAGWRIVHVHWSSRPNPKVPAVK